MLIVIVGSATNKVVVATPAVMTPSSVIGGGVDTGAVAGVTGGSEIDAG